MKVFKIDQELFDVPLTVDSTLITVDSTEYTADQTIIDSYPYRIKVIPRFTSQTFSIRFKHNLTEIITFVDVEYFQYFGDYLNAYFDYPFLEGDSFEITIRDTSNPDDRKNLMWRGLGYATMQDDLENYQLNVKNNDGIVYID